MEHNKRNTQQTIITSQVTLNNKQGSLINIEYNIPETSNRENTTSKENTEHTLFIESIYQNKI